MINKPSIEFLTEKLGTKDEPISRYALCSIASKRARQIIAMRESNIDGKTFDPPENELTIACREIADGKIIIMKD